MKFAEPTLGHERRSSVMLAQYWNKLRGGNDLPSEEELNPDELIGLWERCFLLQLRDMREVVDYNYTYFGEDLIHAYEDGRLEKGNGKIVGIEAKQLAEQFTNVITESGPVMDEGEYQDSHGRNVKYRQIFMPLGDKSGTINAIFGSAWFKLD